MERRTHGESLGRADDPSWLQQVGRTRWGVGFRRDPCPRPHPACRACRSSRQLAARLPGKIPGQSDPEEKAAMYAAAKFANDQFGYFKEQATRPQTIGYALADSPVGQATWIYEKFQAWTDNRGEPEDALTVDEMLDDISLYWFTDTAASSARNYWENARNGGGFDAGRIELPMAATIFPKEIYRAPKAWAEAHWPNLVYWNEVDKGGRRPSSCCSDWPAGRGPKTMDRGVQDRHCACVPSDRPMEQCRPAGVDAAIGQSDPEDPVQAGGSRSRRVFGARAPIGLSDRSSQSCRPPCRRLCSSRCTNRCRRRRVTTTIPNASRVGQLD